MTTKRPTPVKSIRQYCMWCCNEQIVEVSSCTATKCYLYPYRMGKKGVAGSVVKKIRAKCLDCRETQTEVKSCEHKDCNLYHFRMGTRFRGEPI